MPPFFGHRSVRFSSFHVIQNTPSPAPYCLIGLITINHEKDKSLRVIKIHNQGAIATEIVGNFFGKYVTAGKKGCTGIGTYAAKMLTEVQ
jgi:two-component system sensor histidine kinase/response regulator